MNTILEQGILISLNNIDKDSLTFIITYMAVIFILFMTAHPPQHRKPCTKCGKY